MAEPGGNGSDSSTPGATPNPTPQPATGTPPNAGATPDDGNEEISVESYRRLQASDRKHRLAAKDFADRLAELEGAKLTEAEKTAQRLKQLEEDNAHLQHKAREAEVVAAAASSGARQGYAEVISRLVDDGEEDIGKAIRGLKRQYPDLFIGGGPAGTANGGASGPPPGADTSAAMDAFIRGRLGR